MEFILNKDKQVVERINKGLKIKKEKYGELYCPCILPTLHDTDHICPCKEFIEETPIGELCHCGKYQKID